jgi:hypothetical protein
MKRMNLKESPVTEDLTFFAKHPEYDGYGAEMRGTYRLCQIEKVKGRMYISLEEAYNHIKKCEHCQETMRLKIEAKEHPR